MKVQRCKGTRDLSPEEMASFRRIERAFGDSCRKWGYEEVRTPTLEYLHLFTSTGTLTPSMLGRVYSFLDWDGWSGERVVLRPDGTIPIARLYINSMEEKELAKLFYVANIFILEETGEKTRERWQCGAELIGVSSPQADVELITLALEVLKRLGMENIELRLSHAGLIRALLQKLGLSPEEQSRIFDQILDGNEEALAKIKRGKTGLGRALYPLLNLKGNSSGFLRNLKAQFAHDLTGLESYINDFTGIVSLLDVLGCDYQIDIASARGFEYYTGVTFQLSAGEEKIGGGGRYDALIPLMGGREIPASGFALYLDRLMGMVKPEISPPTQRILIKADQKAVKEGFSTARSLREAGYVAELDLCGKEPVDYRWTLGVQSEAPPFVLTDLVRQKRSEVQNIAEVLALLGEESADKTGPT